MSYKGLFWKIRKCARGSLTNSTKFSRKSIKKGKPKKLFNSWTGPLIFSSPIFLLLTNLAIKVGDIGDHPKFFIMASTELGGMTTLKLKCAQKLFWYKTVFMSKNVLTS